MSEMIMLALISLLLLVPVLLLVLLLLMLEVRMMASQYVDSSRPSQLPQPHPQQRQH